MSTDAKQCPWCERWALKDTACNYIFACGLQTLILQRDTKPRRPAIITMLTAVPQKPVMSKKTIVQAGITVIVTLDKC